MLGSRRCPVCGSELREIGYPKDFFQYYACPNYCEFETPLSWKVENAIDIIVGFFLLGFFAVLFGIAGIVQFAVCKLAKLVGVIK
jgi:hypothetical protein